MVGTDLIDLHVIAVDFRRQAPGLEFLGLLVEFPHAALELHPEPDVFVLVKPYRKAAGRQVGFEQWNLIVGDFSRFWLQLTENHLAKARVPGESLGVHNHVMWLSRFLRQIVFGVDDFGRSSFWPG